MSDRLTKAVIFGPLAAAAEWPDLARIRQFDRFSDDSPITDPSSQHLSSFPPSLQPSETAGDTQGGIVKLRVNALT